MIRKKRKTQAQLKHVLTQPLFLKKNLGQHLLKKRPKHLLGDFKAFLEDNLCIQGGEVSAEGSSVNNEVKSPGIDFGFNNILHIVEIGPGPGAVTFQFLELLSDIANGDIMFCENKKKFINNKLSRQINKDLLVQRNLKGALNSVNGLIKVRIYFIEIDPKMIAVLKQNLHQFLNRPKHMKLSKMLEFYYVNADATKVELNTIIRGLDKKEIKKFVQGNKQIGSKSILYIFGALPYNVSKNIILHIASQYNILMSGWSMSSFKLPAGFTYIIQKEVAEAFVAKPPKATLLSSLLQLYVDEPRLKILQKIPPTYFAPPPKVDSAVIAGRLSLSNIKIITQQGIDIEYFKQILKLFARYPRKGLGKIAMLLNKHNQISDACKQYIMQNFRLKRFAELGLQEWIDIIGRCGSGDNKNNK